MKQLLPSLSSLLLLLALLGSACGKTYHYESVKGDPMKTRIYTLENGLKVYLSVNKETPRIQTYIAVRVGAKNDPSETTGLAHYFEHIMFKGTQSFGTTDYEKERPLLEEISNLFEAHRATNDPIEKSRLYHLIDSISYEASRYAIANEYDKLMASIGGTESNAHTSYDETIYKENIPANQIENWARIQADRFESPVIRGFHTELETVYEEKNMSLAKDSQRAFESLLELLFPDHPYGTQSVLGTQWDLKNPSIKNIIEYHKKYYVPNNMAITMSGDLDPDETIKIIEKYFGNLKPNPEVDTTKRPEVAPLTQIQEKEVSGQEAEMILMGWRVPGVNDASRHILDLLSAVLYNGETGLIDEHLLMNQSLLSSQAFTFDFVDYDVLGIVGYPKEGQSLEEVKALCLREVERLKSGDFDETLLKATIANHKLALMKALESNTARAMTAYRSFISNTPWEKVVHMTQDLETVTKEQIVAYANEYLTENYGIVYKRQNDAYQATSISKPEITPILTNRDKQSDFLKEILSSKVTPIAPVFPDYGKEISIISSQKASREIIYKKNETNDIFWLTYLFEPGLQEDKYLPYALGYLSYLGTESLEPMALKREMYNLAGSYTTSTSGRRASITISGLRENMPQIMQLVEQIFSQAKGDPEAFASIIMDERTTRLNALSNQDSNFEALSTFVTKGPQYIEHSTVSNEELASIKPEDLLGKIHDLMKYPHKVIYYGPDEIDIVENALSDYHPRPAVELTTPEEKSLQIPISETRENVVYVLPYSAPNFYLMMFNNQEKPFDISLAPRIDTYNAYFGYGMNSILFQELREARGLAYIAQANYFSFGYQRPYAFSALIVSQNDKLHEASQGLSEIINEMPQAPEAFQIAKEGLVSQMRTARTSPQGMAWRYLSLLDYELPVDGRTDREAFEALQKLSLEEITLFQQENVKGQPHHYAVLGDPQKLDMEYLSRLGKVVLLSPKEVFGH